MIGRFRRSQRSRPGFDIRQPQPVLDPMAIEPELSGAKSRILETSHNRLMLGAGLFAVAFLVITVRLAMVTLLPEGEEPAVAHKSGVAPVADRADILDRNGVVLATSLTTASLFANPKQIRDPDDTAERLNMVLPDLNIASTAAKLDTGKTFIWLKRNLTPKQQDGVNRLGIPGLYFQMEAKRIYPQGSLMSHVVGFTDVDSRGLAGVERSFDDLLAGGQRPLQLSIDIRIQHIVHEEVSRAITDFNGIGGVGIVTDVKTGEVLSLVSLPDFDPTDPGAADPDTRFNRATLGVFEMGSVFKIFNTAIALDSKTCKISDGYDASHPIKISRFTIDDFHGKHRYLSLPEIFTYSSNIGSAKMADQFGAEVQQSYLAKFGLLDKSPIELPEVGVPMYPAAKNWKRINTMTVSYGHGISVSPMQLVSGVAATVNHGLMIPPTLLKRGPNEVPAGHRVVSEKVSTSMRQLMRLVTLVGTGKFANTPGYQVGGKTGTADKEKGGRYSEHANLASFIAAFPMNDPRYAILVMVDEPKGNKKSFGYATGGWVSAPAVGSIVERMAPLMGISPMPVVPPEEENPLVAFVPDYDSPASKKSHSLVMEVKATAPLESKQAEAKPAAIPPAHLELHLRLNDLISATDIMAGNADFLKATGPLDVEIAGLTADSRQAAPGFLFAALPGTQVDGRNFVPAAIKAGAAALLLPEDSRISVPSEVAVLTAANPRKALALMAARFAGAQPKIVVAVTGTSGKTSTSVFARQLWTLLGHRAGSLGTIGVFAPGYERSESLTTPDPIELHRILADLARANVDHLAIEASSHGLDQYRLDGVQLAAAAFTNLSRDHLDYHPTMEAYLDAKLRLFEELLPAGAAAVVNADIEPAARVREIAKRRGQRLITFGRGGSEIKLLKQVPGTNGQTLELEVLGKRHTVTFPVVGIFQAENLLAALGLVIGAGADPEKAIGMICRVTGVHGRIEHVATTANGASIYVDYAHKPAGLEAVLSALRPHAEGRLFVLFGCGGDRDPGKRPQMGEIATKLADRVIVTDDNPRTEDPAKIRAAILAGAPSAVEIGDRAEAIKVAIGELKRGDLLVIAGKGHETYQIIGKVKHPFDDSAVARAVVQELGGAQ